MIWKQSELNKAMLATVRKNLELYQKSYDSIEGDTEDSRLLQLLIYMSVKAEKGIQLGKTFTQSVWGLNTAAPITHSWVIVQQIDYSPVLKGVGVKFGENQVEFLLKPDGGFDGFATYGINDARRLVSWLINNAPEEHRHWYYLYNMITGAEERVFYPETLPI